MNLVRWAGYLTGAVLILVASVGEAQTRVGVGDVRSDVNRWLNERVELTGVVQNYVQDRASTSRFYILRDDFGRTILVRTGPELPETNAKYTVIGTVSYDVTRRELFVHEDQRIQLTTAEGLPVGTASGRIPVGAAASAAEVSPPAATATTPTESGTEVAPAAGWQWWEVALVVGLGALLIGIVAALIVVLRGKRRTAGPPVSDFNLSASLPAHPVTAPNAGVLDIPAPQEVIEGRTIKMHAPPPNTIKLLPGWLEVVSGDEVVKQIRFYKLKGDATSETTFGRAVGRPYAHIQLKPMTVSSRQAKVSFEPGGPRLTNFAAADSNPTKVNGRELAVGESVALQEGDMVEMGEVVFRHHAQ